MTVSQAVTAMVTTPTFSRRIRSTTPSGVISAGLRLYRPARPPAKASRNRAPSPIPWIRPHHSRSVKRIGSSLPDADGSYDNLGLRRVELEGIVRPPGTATLATPHNSLRMGPLGWPAPLLGRRFLAPLPALLRHAARGTVESFH